LDPDAADIPVGTLVEAAAVGEEEVGAAAVAVVFPVVVDSLAAAAASAAVEQEGAGNYANKRVSTPIGPRKDQGCDPRGGIANVR
jgi:hypothetical protein